MWRGLEGGRRGIIIRKGVKSRKKIDRQTDRQTDGQTHSQTERERETAEAKSFFLLRNWSFSWEELGLRQGIVIHAI